MMKWGRKKPVSSSSSSGLSRALPVSWFSKSNASFDSKPVKETSKKKKKQNDEEASKNKSDEKFEEIMSNVRKKVRDFQIETRGGEAMEKDKETLMIMTPRIRDKQRCERRDQKLLEQNRKTSTKPGQQQHQWQKLKEIKLREVKLKADQQQQQRKSLYIRRELNPNTKVRVFSPRATEKCRVKAIEDLKKAAKARATENESFAVVKCSNDPQKDFRDSMIEMIMENGINHPEELKELLVCYLRLNSDEYHDMIIKVFQQVHNDLNFHYFGVE